MVVLDVIWAEEAVDLVVILSLVSYTKGWWSWSGRVPRHCTYYNVDNDS